MVYIVLDYKGCHADSKHIDNCINKIENDIKYHTNK